MVPRDRDRSRATARLARVRARDLPRSRVDRSAVVTESRLDELPRSHARQRGRSVAIAGSTVMRLLVLLALACVAVGAIVAWRNWPADEYRLYRLRQMRRERALMPAASTGVHYHCRADDGSP